MMKHFPIFMKVDDKRICLIGNGEDAVAKARLLSKSDALLEIYAPEPAPSLRAYLQAQSQQGLVIWHERAFDVQDIDDATRPAIAFTYLTKDAADLMPLFARRHMPVCVIDDLAQSSFTTPALVDRAPVTIAIGTEGTAPVLARQIKQMIEEKLPQSLGRLARVAASLRTLVSDQLTGLERRLFWSQFFADVSPSADIATITASAHQMIDDIQSEAEADTTPHVWFVGAGPGNPDLLTMQARRILHDADVILHDQLISAEVLELCRREAEVISVGKRAQGPSWAQEDINDLLIAHARGGAKIVRLKSGDAGIYGRLDEEITALTKAGIAFDIAAGLTSATVGASIMGASLTRRSRNSAYRILTGHDMRGYADYDWREMAKGLAEGQFTASIYMSVRASSYVAGRLLMHGAPADLAVTVAEHISRENERFLTTTLRQLPDDMVRARITGPAVIYLGLAPHEQAIGHLHHITFGEAQAYATGGQHVT